MRKNNILSCIICLLLQLKNARTAESVNIQLILGRTKEVHIINFKYNSGTYAKLALNSNVITPGRFESTDLNLKGVTSSSKSVLNISKSILQFQ